ncbi:EF-hand domain-containing protein [Streptacidiphilus pinicola]|uniref:EF-hand domain-containing protein n=1 Tax=Streptacidiphilus pinicola TaxID=2219663 RepID=A0A2X0IFD0_9ACTN|nr:EF-hand domain-containing protein [Streptacidiphilus pinicola]RAG83762.1 EF-hand domain-containing protein [Streptacidiphilus pinicola]
MSQDFLDAKIGWGFDHLDADGDGRLTEADHRIMGRSVAASLGHPAGGAEEARIVDAYVSIWHDLHAPHLPEGVDAITRDQFVGSTGSLVDQPDAARALLGGLAEAFLAIADADGDGRVELDEFFLFQRGHFAGFSREQAAEAFAKLDRDGDGCLDADEFVTAIVEFWTSSDPAAPGNWWAGQPRF